MFISTLLKSFIVTAKNNSMKDGAKKLFITESPLSRRIRNLEEQLGYKVFVRGRDGVTLTKEGMDIYNAILPHYDELASLEEYFLNIHKLKKKPCSMKLGLNVYIEYNALGLMSDFIYTNPDVIKKLSYGDFNEDVTPSLLNNELDLIISNDQLAYDYDVVDYLPIPWGGIDLAQSKNVNTQDKKTLIITNSLFTFLDRKNNGWNKWLVTAMENTSEIDIITIPEIINHLCLIESGDVIGLIPNSMTELINDKFKGIKTSPLLIDNSRVTMDFNAYFKKEKSDIIIERFISKL
ncbi:LysR family transcriptional regulator [Yersinia enterocolitica]|uniref:LysR family transcriptional regulator n=1 Tax=Yersinia enterocolitica TaxID=630 RepID=UPI000976D5D8|nr:LysR family transcriptional regulator [Yersinia enterocolitica]ELI7922736.1 LysR family transcriptional regulator [Yersinia enterocolitica]